MFRILVYISAALVIPVLGSSHTTLGPELPLAAGTEPHCALGPDGVLHIVYKYNGIKYMTLDKNNNLSQPVALPGTGGSHANPWIHVGTDGSVHIVSDTYSDGWYSNRIGGSWKSPTKLPKVTDQRNYHCQVSGGYQSEVYTSAWNMTKTSTHVSYFTRIKNVSGTPTTETVKNNDGKNRPPSVLGPSSAFQEDGKVHLIMAGIQSTHFYLESNGNISSGTNISRIPGGKTLEGMQAFFIDSEIGFVTQTVVGSDADRYKIFLNTLSRAKSGKNAILIDDGLPKEGFPRAAYDPINLKVYILYPKKGSSQAALWDPSTEQMEIIGKVTTGSLSTGARGPGAGGIARHDQGGVHLVYSTGSNLFHRTMGTAPGSISINKLKRKIESESYFNIFPNPFNPATTINISLKHMELKPTLRIYNMQGKMVKDFGILNTPSLVWNPFPIGSGMYLIKLNAGSKTYLSTVTLIK